MRELPRFVFDTNCLLSAAISPDGKSISSIAYAKARSKGMILVSDKTYLELKNVLFKGKFDAYISIESRNVFLEQFFKATIFIQSESDINDCRDPKDNKFLALAIDGRAQILISGDKDLLILDPYKNIRILTPGAFLEGLN